MSCSLIMLDWAASSAVSVTGSHRSAGSASESFLACTRKHERCGAAMQLQHAVRLCEFARAMSPNKRMHVWSAALVTCCELVCTTKNLQHYLRGGQLVSELAASCTCCTRVRHPRDDQLEAAVHTLPDAPQVVPSVHDVSARVAESRIVASAPTQSTR